MPKRLVYIRELNQKTFLYLTTRDSPTLGEPSFTVRDYSLPQASAPRIVTETGKGHTAGSLLRMAETPGNHSLAVPVMSVDNYDFWHKQTVAANQMYLKSEETAPTAPEQPVQTESPAPVPQSQSKKSELELDDPVHGFMLTAVLPIVVIAFAGVLAGWTFIMAEITDTQREVLRWLLPLASGVICAAWPGRLVAKSAGVPAGLAITATGGFGVWLITFLLLWLNPGPSKPAPTKDKPTPDTPAKVEAESKSSSEKLGDLKPPPSTEKITNPPAVAEKIADPPAVTEKIAALLSQLPKSQSRGDTIRLLREGMDDIEKLVPTNASIPLRVQLGRLYMDLSREYEQGQNYDHAFDANEMSWKHLKIGCDKDPMWKDPTIARLGVPAPPLGLLAFGNRLNAAYLRHALVNGVLDATSRTAAENDIRVAERYISKMTLEEIDAAQAWNYAALANWATRSMHSAEVALEEAFKSMGKPGAARSETHKRRAIFFELFMLRAALSADQGKCDAAKLALKSAEQFSWQHGDPDHHLGYLKLTVARCLALAAEKLEPGDNRTPEQIAAHQAAISELKAVLSDAKTRVSGSGRCPICDYNRVCILAKLSQLSEDVTKEELTKEATALFVEVLDRLKSCPIEPEIAAIRRDPFLTPILTSPTVIKELNDFEWEAPAVDGRPPLIYKWHDGVPYKRVRYLTINGDSRD